MNPVTTTVGSNKWVQGFSIQNQYTKKSTAFLNTRNEESEREIKDTIPFTIAPQNNKIGI